MLPPPNWEYMKAPWYFGLVIKVFRRDPQLALDVADVVADVTNAPLSRAELKRQRQKEALEGNSKKSPLLMQVLLSHLTLLLIFVLLVTVVETNPGTQERAIQGLCPHH